MMKFFTKPIKIDSAVTFENMKINNGGIDFDKHDKKYKLLAFTNAHSETDDLVFPVVSENGKHWHLALGVIAGGKKLDLKAMSYEAAEMAYTEETEE